MRLRKLCTHTRTHLRAKPHVIDSLLAGTSHWSPSRGKSLAECPGIRTWSRSCASQARAAGKKLDRISQTPVRRGAQVFACVKKTDDGRRLLCADSQASQGAAASFFGDPRVEAEKMLARVFLPVGYPESVTKNYLNFVKFATAQQLFSHVSRVLSTQAMLLALGVGAKTALPLAAVTSWILKDGLGHLGAIAMGTVVNTRFDSDPKRYRFCAAVLGKTADLISLFTLHRPEYFLLFSTIGTTLGRMSTTTVASCRAKVYETFVAKDNLGDISRCAQAQTTFAHLLGIAFGAALGPAIGRDVPQLFMATIVLTCGTLFASYRACDLVQMSTLNVQRSELILQKAVAQIPSASSVSVPGGITLPDPEEIRKLEVFVKPYKSVVSDIKFDINPLLEKAMPVEILESQRTCELAEPYTFAFSKGTGDSSRVSMWFHRGARHDQVIKGFFHACLLRSSLSQYDACPQEVFRDSERLAQAWWPEVELALDEAGWRCDVAFLDTPQRRISPL